MNFVIGAVVFLLGCIIGSFLNVCIFRIPKEESIAFPPSHCGNCNHRLSTLDLVPILSYIFLKGKCRYCGDKLSVQYPMVEGLTGVLFLLVYFKYGLSYGLIKYILFAAWLMVIAIIDFKTEDVYDSTIITGAIIGIILLVGETVLVGNIDLLSIVLGVIIPSTVIALIVILTKGRGMAWGDVEILAVVGLFTGFKLGMLNLFLSIILGGVAAVILMMTRKKTGKETMAFGPYIAIASFITILIGEGLINFYITTFVI